MALKTRQKSSPVVNVVLGQVATHDLNSGPRYHGIRYICTITKTAATGGFTSAQLADVLGLITVNVNNSPVRTHLATELNAVQTKWHTNLAAKQYDGLANDLLTAVADVVAGGNTTRTTTWVLDLWLMDPSRDSYTSRQAFAWPTQWVNAAGQVVQQVAVQIQLAVPANAGMATPIIRAEETFDFVNGPYAKTITGANGLRTPDYTSNRIMPVTFWYRQPETYAGTALVIKKFPFSVGSLQQTTVFCQAGDDVGTMQVKIANQIVFDRSKISNDDDNQSFDWNPSYGAGTAGVNYLNADMFDCAFDYNDDPTTALPQAALSQLEYDVNLTQAAAGNKTIYFVSQVYASAI